MTNNILVADDDNKLRKLICDMLQKQGYTTIEATNGKEAIQLFQATPQINLCILDILMPFHDGLDVLHTIRQTSNIPVIMLTALGDELHEIDGLKKGADDYIAKPFSYPLFIAKVNRLLNNNQQQNPNSVQLCGITINYSCHQVFVNQTEIELNNKEYQLLNYLMCNKDLILSREQILKKVWGFDYDGDMRTIDAHVKMLRKKLGDAGNKIKTVRGTGYKFEVTQC